MRHYDELAAVCKEKGYKFFDNGAYNLNLIAERTKNCFDNGFTDRLHIAYRDEKGEKRVETLLWTTCAGTLGLYGAFNPITTAGVNVKTGKVEVVKGVAVLKEGQYLRCYKFVDSYDRAKTKYLYPFFEQIGPVQVYRDGKIDNIIDRDVPLHTDAGLGYKFGIWIHPMSPRNVTTNYINTPYVTWSVGCQGAPEPLFKKLVDLARKAAARWGDVFTYTLITTEDFK